jgi:hypothetical protein
MRRLRAHFYLFLFMVGTERRIASKAEVVDAARAAAGLSSRRYSDPAPAEPIESPPASANHDAADFLEHVAAHAHATLHCEVTARTAAAADADQQPVDSRACRVYDDRSFEGMEDPNRTGDPVARIAM